jgi:hypothetical protein
MVTPRGTMKVDFCSMSLCFFLHVQASENVCLEDGIVLSFKRPGTRLFSVSLNMIPLVI